MNNEEKRELAKKARQSAVKVEMLLPSITHVLLLTEEEREECIDRCNTIITCLERLDPKKDTGK